MENNYSNYYETGGVNRTPNLNTQGTQSNYTQKPQKKKGGAFKKIVIGALVGIVFGIFAGVGFQAVSAASNIIKGAMPAISKVEEKEKTEYTPIEEKKDESAPYIADDEAEDKAEISIPTLEPEYENAVTTVTDVTEVVKETMPALVSVNNKYTEKLNYFGQTYYQDAEGAGSGIIVGQNEQELLLVTNYHVIQDANELKVTFVDNTEAPAQVKGKDEDRDLAVISVQLDDISFSTRDSIAIAKLGNSDALTVGEPVIAIGNSLGYGQSVTTGVVSALNRAMAASTSDGRYSDTEIATFIQTDAAINPGNSGGALINMKGEVIGINSNKIGGSAVEGMGYAIPISSAKPIIEDMMNRQTRMKADEDNKGYLGITGVDVDEELSATYGIPVGVYISSVNPGTGADAANLIRGDIIVGLNGVEITCMDDLKTELSYYTAGTTVELKIMQGSPTGYQAKNVTVTLSAAAQ